jgi:hypothetical protein
VPEFHTGMPLHTVPPELLDDDELELLLEELDDELLEDELELLLDELEDELLEDEPVASQAPRSFHALVQAQPVPGAYAPPWLHQPPTVH